MRRREVVSIQTRLFARARLLPVSAFAPAPPASHIEPPLQFQLCRLVRRSCAPVHLCILGPE
jgi:hypothetical protein